MATEWRTLTPRAATCSSTFLGGGAAGQHRAGDSVAEREEQVVPQGADKAPLAGGHHHVPRLRRQPVTVEVAEGDDPAMRVNDALGPAGGAGGAHHEGGLVGRGVSGGYVC